MLGSGASEYLFTAGIALSLLGVVVGSIADRRNIAATLKRSGLTRNSVIVAALVVVAFVVIELLVVKPTQLLFFDDAIYQSMAQDLLHMGQAWMCDYGTPLHCFSGEVFHEPIGLSFNLAIGFALMGVSLRAAEAAQLALAAASVFLTFVFALLVFRDRIAAHFSELLMAFSPIVLVWAMPTNSDMALLVYSLLAFVYTTIFARGERNVYSMSNMLLSMALLTYMRVMAALYIPILAVAFLLLQDDGLKRSLMRAVGEIRSNLLNTRALAVVLLFAVTVTPSISYAYLESVTGDYGYRGTQIQSTCAGGANVKVTKSIGLDNFGWNLCANLKFWLNDYTGDYVMQPVAFTALALVGAALMFAKRRRELLMVGVWFLAFFTLYTSFYAGSVIYGVDWRFMLSLIAQASMLGGFCASYIVNSASGVVAGFSGRAARKGNVAKANIAFAAVASIIMFYPVYAMAPLLSVNPAQLEQARGARFYESFVYSNIGYIPNDCVVFSYDPTLFNLNNRTAAQMGYLLNVSFYNTLRNSGRCAVFDYGYWCFTPNNICEPLSKQYNLAPITNASLDGLRTYGFYYIDGMK